MAALRKPTDGVVFDLSVGGELREPRNSKIETGISRSLEPARGGLLRFAARTKDALTWKLRRPDRNLSSGSEGKLQAATRFSRSYKMSFK